MRSYFGALCNNYVDEVEILAIMMLFSEKFLLHLLSQALDLDWWPESNSSITGYSQARSFG